MYGKNAMRRRLSEVQNRRLAIKDELISAEEQQEKKTEERLREELEEIDTEIECLMEDVRRA
jgi:hypothetical protein